MSNMDIKLNTENVELRKTFPEFGAGDTINVLLKIREGNKERIQQFQGTVIQRKNVGSNGETFTIRKISDSIAVERIIPIFSPSIERIELIRKGKVRRSRIYYLRKRKGKLARIKEKI
ncbi:MAG TPA: 50S ribosomal protein L19 [Cytophagales bacterium]|nr:50S ribosomal protein L19 [Cytophagales bacterium]